MKIAGFDVLTAVVMKSSVFWAIITPCILVCVCVNFLRAIRRYIPELFNGRIVQMKPVLITARKYRQSQIITKPCA
jgi:hypothetical protein